MTDLLNGDSEKVASASISTAFGASLVIHLSVVSVVHEDKMDAFGFTRPRRSDQPKAMTPKTHR